MLGDGRERQAFRASQLLAAFKAQGVEGYEQEEYWLAGKASVGLKGFVGLWERGLIMLEDMRKKTLNEAESLMAGYTRSGLEGIKGMTVRRRLTERVGEPQRLLQGGMAWRRLLKIAMMDRMR
jgi:hypothetical protein